MMDWIYAGYVEKVSMSLTFCTRAHPSAVDIWFNAMAWISSDLDKYDYSSAAKARTMSRRRPQPGQLNAKEPSKSELRHIAATPR
jgi:hypothetical protein